MTDLHRTLIGDRGEPVVFLHGLFGQGKNWTSVARALAGRHRVLLLDLPNHGRSGWTESVGFSEMADAVAATLTELGRDWGGPAWSVVGHSMGGKTAMTLALRHRELVRQLCVVDISPVSYPRLGNFADYVAGMRSVDLDALSARDQADAVLRPPVPDPVVRSFLLQNLRRENTPAGVRWHWQLNLQLLGDSLAELGRWPEPGPGTAPYPGPVLWVAGADSDYVRPEYAPAMRALFPSTRLVTIKHAGHWVHSEQPAVFLDVLRRFLDSAG